MPTARRFLSKLIPPTPISRQLALQSLLWAMGAGTFETGAAFYLFHFVGLSPAQVGLGLTIAGVISFLFSYFAGRFADRIGLRRTWAVCAFIGAIEFALWPLIHGFAAYIVVLALFSIVNAAGSSARNAYVLDVLPPDERVDTQAHMYSSLNVGFTVGALLAGVALAIPFDAVLRWGVPLFSAALYLANSIWITRLPKAPHDIRRAERRETRAPTKHRGPGPLRNPGWIIASVLNGTLTSYDVLLVTVIPLWLVAATDAPRWLLAWLLVTNTVLCIVLPAHTSKGVRTTSDALTRMRWAGGFFVLACAITAATHDTRGLATAALVWVGHLAVTGAELAHSSGAWAMQAELMDPERRGEYGGVARAANQAGSAWAPAVFTWLAIDWHDGSGGYGWAIIAAIYLVALIAIHPAIAAAQRFRQRHFSPAEEVTEAGASQSS
ncbi:MFS transporter [Kribbella sp. NPDC005582]|uniref:MFS transporter n=1 Tax=Kribbella sp. NPDC005582 TaxID=3156893 RepID=UPI0033A7C472